MTNNHPPLPTNQASRNTNSGAFNHKPNTIKIQIKRTDNSTGSACNSMETTERSSTGTNRSSPTESFKQSSHMVIDEHAGRFVSSSTGPTCATNLTANNIRLTPGNPSISVETNTNNRKNVAAHAINEPGRIFYLDDPSGFPGKTTLMPDQAKLGIGPKTATSIRRPVDNTATYVSNSNNNNGMNPGKHIQLEPQSKHTVLALKQLKPPVGEVRTSVGGMSGIDSSSGKPPQSQGTARNTSNTANNNPMIKENKESVGDKTAATYVTTMKNNSATTIDHSLIDPGDKEQALFEQRLCDENYGVAVRKINQYGKPNLRFVKCITVDDTTNARKSGARSLSSHTSASSWGRNSTSLHQPLKPTMQEGYDTLTSGLPSTSLTATNARRVLTWGKKKEVQVALDSFLCVRKGKTTDRAKKNTASANRILSLITKDPHQISLDIEAPTQMDRDKFARAFARFLAIPLEGDDRNLRTADAAQLRFSITSTDSQSNLQLSSQKNEAGSSSSNIPTSVEQEVIEGSERCASFPLRNSMQTINAQPTLACTEPIVCTDANIVEINEPENTFYAKKVKRTGREQKSTDNVSGPVGRDMIENDGEDNSHISSLTGNGFDHELVEELHNAINELRGELEESRAEAARAVKVAEQAIQSAEKNNSIEWQNTVTHKAAEAAARAQKQSATAIAKARLAEERLGGERRAALYWKKQAETAEKEASALQTRVAAAEVQRAAMEEQLKTERRIFKAQLHASKDRFTHNDSSQRLALDEALERTRALELELSSSRQDIVNLNQTIDIEADSALASVTRKKRSFLPRKKNVDEQDSKHLLSATLVSSSSSQQTENQEVVSDSEEYNLSDNLLHLQNEIRQVRRQFEMFRRATVDDIHQLPNEAKSWSNQINSIMNVSRTELVRLREQLVLEAASRRKLLHKVQDLSGTVRVYCRPRPFDGKDKTNPQFLLVPSHDTLVIKLEEHEPVAQAGFEFDYVFQPTDTQQDVYTEIQDVCLSVLDGYNICLMAFGSAGSGKTYSLLGNIHVAGPNFVVKEQELGIHFRLMQQLFTIRDQRKDEYQDSFSLSIVEVYDEKLCDLSVGTKAAELRGDLLSADMRSSRQNPDDDNSNPSKLQTKLEIRSNVNGETIVQGLLSVTVETYAEVQELWEESLKGVRQRLADQNIDSQRYRESSHLIATVTVTSVNISTGCGSKGRIQFVDLASADVIRRHNESKPIAIDDVSSSLSKNNTNSNFYPPRDWRFTNKSLETLYDIVEAKLQFERIVPYRNSTLTHLLQDSFEGDTKVILLACLSSNPGTTTTTTTTTGTTNSNTTLQTTQSVLRFVSRIRRVVVGKATRHTFTSTTGATTASTSAPPPTAAAAAAATTTTMIKNTTPLVSSITIGEEI